MLHFECDYNNGCCEEVLRRLTETNSAFETGYGFDSLSESARNKIREACGCPDADVFLLVGGTQTNATVITAVLRQYEGVVAAESGHINGHEAGAVEAGGHKILSLPQTDGKLDSGVLRAFLETYHADENKEHMVYPGMVYISFPTELGTIYSKAELEALHGVCGEFGIPLFIDGARLGYGLMSKACDVTLKEFAQLCDVFYIGGTKVGALCGEAVVFPHGNAPKHFFSTVKQRGALLAKGRLVGAQFDALFTDGTYFRLAGRAIETAERLKEILREAGCRFMLETPTNQQFVIVSDEEAEALNREMVSCFWEKAGDGLTAIRFCTSWATRDEDLEALRELLLRCLKKG